MEYFWTYETDLPAGTGVEVFGREHLIWVSAAVIFIFVIMAVYGKRTEVIKGRIQVAISTLLVISYIIQWIWAAATGHFSLVEMLPLHLCTISAFVEVIAVISGNTVLKEFSYCNSLPGAIVAFITPGLKTYPLISYMYLQFVFVHAVLILFPLIWVFKDGYRPNICRLPKCTALLLFFAVIAHWVNSVIGSNYMFINYIPDDHPLKIIEAWFGNPGYLIPFTGAILIIWVVLYTPWIINELI